MQKYKLNNPICKCYEKYIAYKMHGLQYDSCACNPVPVVLQFMHETNTRIRNTSSSGIFAGNARNWHNRKKRFCIRRLSFGSRMLFVADASARTDRIRRQSESGRGSCSERV